MHGLELFRVSDFLMGSGLKFRYSQGCVGLARFGVCRVLGQQDCAPDPLVYEPAEDDPTWRVGGLSNWLF